MAGEPLKSEKTRKLNQGSAARLLNPMDSYAVLEVDFVDGVQSAYEKDIISRATTPDSWVFQVPTSHRTDLGLYTMEVTLETKVEMLLNCGDWTDQWKLHMHQNQDDANMFFQVATENVVAKIKSPSKDDAFVLMSDPAILAMAGFALSYGKKRELLGRT